MVRSDSDLSSAACWALLATASVGRIALSIRAMPMIVPMRYRVDDGSVAISLGRPGLPVATVHDAVVAFAVDDIDQGSATGWMVQMQGRARLATSLASSGSSTRPTSTRSSASSRGR
jgi:nitroimidazol reductase NimA-like FMN-containing flavoprotein (pyridoxamine 5'-phosphate oxidase superfamily)